MIFDFEHFKALCIGAKDCKAPLMNTIQGNLGAIVVKCPLSQMTEFDICYNDGTSEVKSFEKKHRLIYEFKEFMSIMKEIDVKKQKDMLQNGTVISETMIEIPKSFSTACNVATQIIAQVASSQYGGQSITLSHLAPFVDVSRQKFRKEVKEEFETIGLELDDEKINALAEERLKIEITKGVQTIQNQVVTLMTTNGQAPFITVFMYLNEVPEGRLRDDLAMIIEETLKQRMKGVKNEKGVYITPAFPKLIYVLDEDNITEDSRYWD